MERCVSANRTPFQTRCRMLPEGRDSNATVQVLMLGMIHPASTAGSSAQPPRLTRRRRLVGELLGCGEVACGHECSRHHSSLALGGGLQHFTRPGLQNAARTRRCSPHRTVSPSPERFSPRTDRARQVLLALVFVPTTGRGTRASDAGNTPPIVPHLPLRRYREEQQCGDPKGPKQPAGLMGWWLQGRAALKPPLVR